MHHDADRRSRTITVALAEGVSADLVLPVNDVPRAPGLVFLHWGFGNRSTFASEARALAAAGVVSLLLDAPGYGGRPGGVPALHRAGPAAFFARQTLNELHQAIDLLSARAEVDPERLGYVGFSLGASLAGAFAGHEPRLKAVVVMGGYAELSRSWPLRRSDAYAAALREFDSVRSIGRSKASWLLQFARNDAFVAPENGEQLLAAAPEPSS